MEIIAAIEDQTRIQFNNAEKYPEMYPLSETTYLRTSNEKFWEVVRSRINMSTSASLYGCITPTSALELKRVLSGLRYGYHGDIILYDIMANATPLAQLADAIDGNTSTSRTRLISATTDLTLRSQPFGHNLQTDFGIVDILGPYLKTNGETEKTMREFMMHGISPGGLLMFRDFYRMPIQSNSMESKTITNDPELTTKREAFRSWLQSIGFDVSNDDMNNVLNNLWGPDRQRVAGSILRPYKNAFGLLKHFYPASKMRLFTVGIEQYKDITDGYYIIGIITKGKRYLHEKTDYTELPAWANN